MSVTRTKRTKHPLPDPGWPTAAEAGDAMLFQPIDVGPIRLVERTWVPAMVPWRAAEEGSVTPELLAWYARFAAGQPGAIVVEATGVRDVPSGPLLRIGHDRFLEGLSRLVDVVQEASGGRTRLFIQLIDFLMVKRRPPAEKYFRRFLEVDDALRSRVRDVVGDQPWIRSPESEFRQHLLDGGPELWPRALTPRQLDDLERGYRERVTDMHLPHVAELPRVLPGIFAAAARRAEAAGFDGVELHCAHAYTLASFLSKTNTRSDGYGGTIDGRFRLPAEVCGAVRASVSGKTAVGVRFLTDEVITGGSRVEDAADFGVRFARAGVDYLSLSKGGRFEDAKQPRVGWAVYPYTGPSGHECMPTVYASGRGPFGRNLPLIREVRRAVRGAGFEVPVVAAGGLSTFALAEGALQRGDADIIGSARQSLADPDWFAKVRSGAGQQVRRCVKTNYCEGLDQAHKQVTCRLWDRNFEDGRDGLLLSHDGKRRLVAPPWKR